jgi:oligopeptide transport system substrate-binding protein
MSNKLTLAILGGAAVLILGLAVVLVVVVAGGGDKKSSTPATDSGTPASGTPVASKTKSSTGGAPAPGTLRLRGDDPLSLDPAIAQDAGSAVYIAEIFSGLVRIDKDLKVQPDVAESWDVSADGKTYTFHINKKAQFQDGRPVLAADVKYSWERALNPDTLSVTAENFLGDIVGARDVVNGTATEISGLKIIDDSTIAVTIDAPKQFFLYKLAYPTSFLVDSRQVGSNKKSWTQRPNGTGPYKLKEWKLGEKITLEANANHHLGAPKLKTVQYDLTGGSALVSYEDGDIDVTGVGLDDLDRVQDPSDKLHAEYQTSPSESLDYVGFNTTTAPVDDPKVRQAFALATDRSKIAEVVLKGSVPVANGILMPGVPGYTKDDKTYAYDPVKAKQLLSESKYGNNLGEITMALSGAGATAGAYDEALVQMWKDNLGVDVKITQAEAATFFNDIDEGKYQMFHLGWVMDYPDPEDVLDILFYSKSRQNNTRYSNPAIDAKLEAARIETDPAKRLAAYQDIEKQLVQDAPWMPMFFGTTHALVKPYVEGFSFPPLIIERFRDVQVNP